MTLLTEAEVTVSADALLSCIWYGDGSGARGISVGLDSPSDLWTIAALTIDDDKLVHLRLVRK